MTKKSLKIFRIALAAMLVVCALFAFAACGSKVSGISVGRNDMPKLTYVEGQELDLSSGKLTVDYGGKTETIPLNSNKVSVTGYDNTKVGKQKITVSYEGKTTEFEITLVARVRAENAQTVYYVGEAFDFTRGRLVIANDDATTFTVSFSDEAVTFTGFDSSTPADAQKVTAVYSKDGKTYGGSFNVSVFTADEANFNKPRKSAYNSHETLSVAGAYITFKHAGSYEKQIAVTDDMVEGVDFSLVTAENSPMEQTATVKYCGKEFTFVVTVTYSEVSALNDILKKYDFKWNEPAIPEITEEVGEKAIECMKLYFDLSLTEREYVDETACEAAARTATAYAYKKWDEAFSALKDTVTINENRLLYVLSSYEAAKSDGAFLSDENSAVNENVAFLTRIAEVFENLTVGGDKIADYLAKVTLYGENREEVAKGVNFIVSLAETLKTVPAEWKDLTAYADNINAARDLIVNGEFNKPEYRDLLAAVSVWREKNDFYDIIYDYYYAQKDTASIDALKNIVLPAKLNEIYNRLFSAIMAYSSITQEQPGGGYATDSTYLVYYFKQAKAARDEALTNGRDFYEELYETATFDGVLVSDKGETLHASFTDLFRFVMTSGYGYYDLAGGTLDDSDLVALWDEYLKIYETSPEDEKMAEAMKSFAEHFANLSAGQQQSFLTSINVYYEGYDKPALDMEVGYSVLTRMLRIYYSENLSDEEFQRLQNLLFAIESYSKSGYNPNAVKDFLKYIDLVSEGYNDHNNETFREIFDSIYQRYLAISYLYDIEGSLVEDYELPEEWKEVFKDVVSAVDEIERQMMLITPEDNTKASDNGYVRLYASYETALRLANKILTEAPEEVKESYYRVPVEFSENVALTLDYAISVQAMRIGVFFYGQINVGSIDLYELIEDDTSFRDFIAASREIVWTEASATETISAEKAAEVMKSFIKLSAAERLIFTQIQEIHGADETEYNAYYYDGLKAIFANAFKDGANVKAAAETLLEAERAFTEYLALKGADEENRDADEFAKATAEAKTAYEKLEAAVSALNASESSTFNGYFAEILEFYRNAAKDVK